jgi:hypothetical protein
MSLDPGSANSSGQRSIAALKRLQGWYDGCLEVMCAWIWRWRVKSVSALCGLVSGFIVPEAVMSSSRYGHISFYLQALEGLGAY